ncbi:MAG: hypothetical protein IKE55_03350 [Kiritimatiellae bacterium]|nr:hypothetical protein [Kiritimatiellia bacterium]
MKTDMARIALLAAVACVALSVSAAGKVFPTDVNVRDFGAKGDGIADDTAAIQSAADEASRRAGAMRTGVCWRNYIRAAIGDGPMPRIVFPEGTYRLSGPVFFCRDNQLYGLGKVTVRASSPDMDIFVFQGTLRHHAEGFTMVGGRHQFLVETYNNESASFTARDCVFRGSSDSAIDSHSWRIEEDGKLVKVGTYTKDKASGRFVRDARRDSPALKPFNNSTIFTVERCRFEDCAVAVDITPDGAVLRELSVVTAASTGCVFRVHNNFHVYGIDVTVKRPSGADDLAVFDYFGASSLLVENSSFRSADGKGVCLVRSHAKPAYVARSLILRNLDVACGGCPEGAIVRCLNGTTPEIIAVADVRDTTGRAVKAVAFDGGITEADYASALYFKGVDPVCTYSLAIGRNSPNVDCSLPPAAERFREDVSGVPQSVPSLKTPLPRDGGSETLWGPDHGVPAEGSGDDTEGMRRLFLAAAKRPGAVVVLPPRHIVLKGTVPVSGKFTVRAAGLAMVETKDDGLTLFDVADGADIAFEHVFFDGGAHHVVCAASNANVMLDHCLSYDSAQASFVMKSRGAKGVLRFRLNGGICYSPVLYDGDADAVLAGAWFRILPPKPHGTAFDSAVGIVNRGNMRYQDILGVPCVFDKNDGSFEFRNLPRGEYRWIDNFGGRLHSLHSRFGGEWGGIPPVYNYGGGKVLIEGSYAWFYPPCTRQTPVFCDTPDAYVRMFGVACAMELQVWKIGLEFRYRKPDGAAEKMPRQRMCCVRPCVGKN